MACHHRLGTAHTVRRRRAWNAIIAFGQHKQSDDIGCGIQSPPLDSTQGRMTSGVACHRRPWTSPTVGRRGAWHEITALGVHRGRSWHDITAIGQNTIGRRRAWHDITTLGQHTRSDYVRHGMTSPPLYSTHGRTTSGMACHHRLWAVQTIKRRRAGHAIIALGRQTRLNDVRRDMTSPSLDSTHGRTMSDVAYHLAFEKHTRSKYVRRCMTSPTLGITHGQTSSGMTCHHRLWTS